MGLLVVAIRVGGLLWSETNADVPSFIGFKHGNSRIGLWDFYFESPVWRSNLWYWIAIMEQLSVKSKNKFDAFQNLI